MSHNWEKKAYYAWNVLVKQAEKRESISYKKLGLQIGIGQRLVRHALSPIQDYCWEEGLPHLTVFAVNQATQEPGSGFIGYGAQELDRARDEAHAHDWNDEINPFQFFLEGESKKTLVGKLLRDPNFAPDVFQLVPRRGNHQAIFRAAVRKAYNRKCAFTDLSFEEGLDACHIIPWGAATDAQKVDPRNGILLNSFHHRLFDAGVITIDSEYEIVYTGKKPGKRTLSQTDCDLVINLPKMRLPQKKGLWPLPEYIAEHNKLLGLPIE